MLPQHFRDEGSQCAQERGSPPSPWLPLADHVQTQGKGSNRPCTGWLTQLASHFCSWERSFLLNTVSVYTRKGMTWSPSSGTCWDVHLTCAGFSPKL